VEAKQFGRRGYRVIIDRVLVPVVVKQSNINITVSYIIVLFNLKWKNDIDSRRGNHSYKIVSVDTTPWNSPPRHSNNNILLKLISGKLIVIPESGMLSSGLKIEISLSY
jgi:hypothetical protein